MLMGVADYDNRLEARHISGDKRVNPERGPSHPQLERFGACCFKSMIGSLLCSWYNLRVCVTHATFPALHTHHSITLGQYVKAHGLTNSPSETAIDIFLPNCNTEIRLLLRKQEWVDTAIQVGVLENKV